jgi:hypothetical protein
MLALNNYNFFDMGTLRKVEKHGSLCKGLIIWMEIHEHIVSFYFFPSMGSGTNFDKIIF